MALHRESTYLCLDLLNLFQYSRLPSSDIVQLETKLYTDSAAKSIILFMKAYLAYSVFQGVDVLLWVMGEMTHGIQLRKHEGRRFRPDGSLYLGDAGCLKGDILQEASSVRELPRKHFEDGYGTEHNGRFPWQN